ncbi:MAG TPA: type II toxin-antitoxin system VapC family toxin [Rhizobiaceae bacterium]|nr:type II toxin-antitoxin system VapC family toxin [Rhizobiaceae bacterium]
MIGLDTNILLRAVLDDDPVQSTVARRLLRSLGEDGPGFVNIVVLMEFFWVLRSRYRLPQARLAEAIRNLLEAEHIEFESLAVAGKALAVYEAGIADFPDAVIAMRNSELGADKTYTFDTGAARSLAAMELLA